MDRVCSRCLDPWLGSADFHHVAREDLIDRQPVLDVAGDAGQAPFSRVVFDLDGWHVRPSIGMGSVLRVVTGVAPVTDSVEPVEVESCGFVRREEKPLGSAPSLLDRQISLGPCPDETLLHRPHMLDTEFPHSGVVLIRDLAPPPPLDLAADQLEIGHDIPAAQFALLFLDLFHRAQLLLRQLYAQGAQQSALVLALGFPDFVELLNQLFVLLRQRFGVDRLSGLGSLGDLLDLFPHLGTVVIALPRQLLASLERLDKYLVTTAAPLLPDLLTCLLGDAG
ncbi:hypothetical protein DXT66_19405 [Nocardia farcinica]|nr:hypothetical protein DXT66_19405 [Nocardia farcinica]